MNKSLNHLCKICFAFILTLLIVVSMINPVYAYGGERLYKAGFIKGMSDSAMALNESEPLTREQLASIILEINALKDVALIVNLSSQYSDTDEISDWARPFVAYCTQSGLMQGVGNNIFAPKSVVKGKQLGAVMLRAMGYDVPWDDVDQKLMQLGIPIENKDLSRREAFTYIWDVITRPLCRDGSALSAKLGKGVITLEPLDNKYTSSWEPNRTWGTCPKESAYYDNGYYFILTKLPDTSGVTIEKFDENWNLADKKELAFTDGYYGGFYHGINYNYFILGNENANESDSFPVFRLIQTDHDFNITNSLNIGNAFTCIPFDFGSVSFAEYGEYLTIHTARKRYLTDDGLNHQSQITIVVNTNIMQVENDLGRFQPNHVSHSFNQFAFYNYDKLVLFDHGDAYPRSLILHIMDTTGREVLKGVSLIDIPGEIGDNWTGITMGGAVDMDGEYVFGFSRESGGKDSSRDVYICIVDKFNYSFSIKKITDCQLDSQSYSEPKVVKLTGDRFMLLWKKRYQDTAKPARKIWYTDDETTVYEYVVLDVRGNFISPIIEQDFKLFSHDPIFADGKVIWVGTHWQNSLCHVREVYMINVSDEWLNP